MIVKYYRQLTIHIKQQLVNRISRISLTNAKNLKKKVQQAAHMLSLPHNTRVAVHCTGIYRVST